MSRTIALRVFVLAFILEDRFITVIHVGCTYCCSSCGVSDCQDIKDLGHSLSGVYHVTPCGTRFGYDVYCDMDTDGGGWLVFQRREDGSVDFYRDWHSYEQGFGNKSGEHWLGLIPLGRILSQGHYELRIDLEDWDNQKRYAKYNLFGIGSSQASYKLEVAGYSGNAGNSLQSHKGQMFSTKDKDNDAATHNHCAVDHHGAWWYSSCREANLNGKYYSYAKTGATDSIHWRQWERNGSPSNYALKKTEMKIRKV